VAEPTEGWIFYWERWNGKLFPCKRCMPPIGSLDLFKETEVENTRVWLAPGDENLSLDELSKRHPAPELVI
jgi:hypothetical protein